MLPTAAAQGLVNTRGYVSGELQETEFYVRY